MGNTKTRARVRSAGSLADAIEDRTGRLARRFSSYVRRDDTGRVVNRCGRRMDAILRIAPGRVVSVDRRS